MATTMLNDGIKLTESHHSLGLKLPNGATLSYSHSGDRATGVPQNVFAAWTKRRSTFVGTPEVPNLGALVRAFAKELPALWPEALQTAPTFKVGDTVKIKSAVGAHSAGTTGVVTQLVRGGKRTVVRLTGAPGPINFPNTMLTPA
jgi:hypothetical protein